MNEIPSTASINGECTEQDGVENINKWVSVVLCGGPRTHMN